MGEGHDGQITPHPNLLPQGEKEHNPFSLAREKIRNNAVKPGGLIPLDPMAALIEDVELCIGKKLKEQKCPLQRNTAIVFSPKQ